jgi:hypothetical protein
MKYFKHLQYCTVSEPRSQCILTSRLFKIWLLHYTLNPFIWLSCVLTEQMKLLFSILYNAGTIKSNFIGTSRSRDISVA